MAAQIIFVNGKEYKVVNWIDGSVYFTTFSAAGKETNVRSVKTKAVVMAALVAKAHAEALEENRRYDWLRARFGIFHVSRPDVKDHMVGEAHDEALRIDAEIGTATIEVPL